ncbi:MBL fold metallo-hydrolase [Heliobacterium undosum]|uniref:MBL fold metallo-hydrolase n=1 Tax=Heliomicrobium undosum TaxID=121734 RepID=A0A845L497_9FIRM|nr:MBL fold metallo-hydrolase [Heliomicrobium undosum]MZP31477.1 MBL fold metallo-hydrolase [Heliomicrobium undosum]
MNRIITLPVNFNFGSGAQTIWPVILKDEQDTVLIDCGYPHFLPMIRNAAEAQEINLGDLTKIVITHHDFDHMGALADFKREYPHVQIISSRIEEKYIIGKEKSLRLQQAEALYDLLPEAQKADAENFHQLLKSNESAKVDCVVDDRERFSWCGGTEIIATPGHMPGHISLYVSASKVLIAGDALVVDKDELCIANPQYTLDMVEAKKSIQKLLSLGIDTIICYHGGVFSRNITASLRKLVNE